MMQRSGLEPTIVSEHGIKSMKLYSHLDRVTNELIAAGCDPNGPLTVADLSPFDNLHYHGTDAVQLAIHELDLAVGHRVAEVGSGLGGPARFLAAQSGCHVTALELQSDLNEFAEGLTARCGLTEIISHLCGDALDGPLENNAFDAVVSWLACYHIPDHTSLFAKIADALKPSGMIYIEDLISRGPFTSAESELYGTRLYGQTAPSADGYFGELERAGFTNIRIDDLSDDWASFTNQRLAEYRSERERHLRIHGPDTVDAIEEFYDAVDQLFQGGNMGGIRVVATLAA
ncbi:MAG: methyltransferase domain-containing protein [Rhodospirillales bacterium]|jgi:cyclopropane fatty-acyl-phospholipid synthase-like methyltransferase|nr:methyltransferase domain-containing protein [Rhodospirillales bacterium]MBT6111014.1 methyltransferase domain-containing protein [Rhodospirillales bacterium]MBT6827224.1 methyltransferase domain-containing protein [Rhodospirillales bacterium]MBT7147970.1 methyltransferase domain-containing protein [Rhodospirillales bacterium]